PKIQLAATGDLASGQTWRWQPVRGARGYFLHAMGARGKELVLWSSAETPDAGMGVVDYLANATVDKWIREKVLLAPSTTTCAMPGGIFAGSGGDAAGGMLRMIAYGSESHIAWPPRPADPKEPWDPEWNVRVRTKSTAMAMLGMDMRAAQDAREAQDQAPEEPAVKSLLKGLLRRATGRMAFPELSLQCRESEQPRYERALEDVGALAVTLLDADAETPDERAILEPGVGETPLWRELALSALFPHDAD